MWSYENPVRIIFGVDSYQSLAEHIGNHTYAVVTYPDADFMRLVQELSQRVRAPELVIDNIVPNPDVQFLKEQCARFSKLTSHPDLIVAIGGGSVIDSAKVFSVAQGDFERVEKLIHGDGVESFQATSLIAVPTTAGTGSEVTCWATVWDRSEGCKYSLALPELYPSIAIVDPVLMLGKPRELTLTTGLDALSHALESIWNIHANPVSAQHAVSAIRTIRDVLPRLLENLSDLELRVKMAEAALSAGLAFSNTKTAIAHNISYAVTLKYGVQHGIACSFTLPSVLHSMSGCGGLQEESLQNVFGNDLVQGAEELKDWLRQMGVSHRFSDYAISRESGLHIIDSAFRGARGRNFYGNRAAFIASAVDIGTL